MSLYAADWPAALNTSLLRSIKNKVFAKPG